MKDFAADTNDCSNRYTDGTTPTPAICELKSVTTSKKTLNLKRKRSNKITVKRTGDSDCPVEGKEVRAKINKAGKKVISISSESEITNEDGDAIFTIKAKKSLGRAKVTFEADNEKTFIIVKVK